MENYRTENFDLETRLNSVSQLIEFCYENKNCLYSDISFSLTLKNSIFSVNLRRSTFAVRETASLGQQMLELGCEN